MKKFSLILTVLAMVLGMTQCRKPVIEPTTPIVNNGDLQTITFGTGNGAKVDVYDYSDLKWSADDKIYVYSQNENGSEGEYLGFIELKSGAGQGQATFSGDIKVGSHEKMVFYYYAAGIIKNTPSATVAPQVSADFTDQTGEGWAGFTGIQNHLIMSCKLNVNPEGSYSGELKPCFAVLPIAITGGSESITVTGVPGNVITVNGFGILSYSSTSKNELSITYANANNKVAMAAPATRTGTDTKVALKYGSTDNDKFWMNINDISMVQGGIVNAKNIVVKKTAAEGDTELASESTNISVNGDLITVKAPETLAGYGETPEPKDCVALIGDAKYETLAAAIAAVHTGETIVMLKNVGSDGVPAAQGISVPSNSNFTVDFAGFEYLVGPAGAGSAGTATQAFQLLKNSNITFKNGTIGCTEYNKTYTWTGDPKGIATIINNYCNLTLENMTIDGTNIAHNGNNVRYICSNNCGTVNYNGETSFITVAGDYAFDVYDYNNSYYTAPIVNWNSTGTITKGMIEISGGTLALGQNLTVEKIIAVGSTPKNLNLGGKVLDTRVNLTQGTLNVSNGTINSGDKQALNVYGKEGSAENYSVLNVASDVTINANKHAICMFGATATTNGYGAVVNMAGTANGCIFVSGNLGKDVNNDMKNIINITGTVYHDDDTAIALNGLATVNIENNASVKGNTGVAVKRGTLNVNGGSVEGFGEAVTNPNPNNNGSENTGSAISATATYQQYGPLAVTINNGTFTSNAHTILNNSQSVFNISGGTFTTTNAQCATVYTTPTTAVEKLVITGGTYSTNPSAYVASGYVAVKNGDVWTVQQMTNVAKIGDTEYATIADALKAAESDNTIEILNGTFGAEQIGSLTIAEAGQVRYKSLTIKPAAGAAPVFTSSVYFGYDDSSTANATISVSGLTFNNASLTLSNYVQATVENCNFTGSSSSIAGALVVMDACCTNHKNPGDYPASQVTIKNCSIDGTELNKPGIRVRNSGNVEITGTTVANAKHNGILFESNASIDNTPVKAISITGCTINNWNASDASEGGRAMRIAAGALASGSTIVINNNTMTKQTLGLDKPDFIKITGSANATVNLNDNNWNNLTLDQLNSNPANYYTAEGTVTLTSVKQ